MEEKKAFGILLGFGIFVAAMICVVSVALYGKVYFFDGYVVTKILWVVAIGSIGCSIVGLMGKSITIPAIAAVLILLCVACDSNTTKSSGKNKCPHCDGAGMVNTGFIDFETCPWCHGSGEFFR